MNLTTLQKHWDQLGKDDPFWAVLTDPSKKGGRWEPKDFFQTGVTEIAGVMEEIAGLNVPFRHDRALDFGCAVGRLSQALAVHFQEVHGVDISPSMLAHANRFNQHAGRCHYHLNAESHLRLFPDQHFDFIYSPITLQHIEPCYQKLYLREFFRILKPGGVAAFQVITAVGWRKLIPDFAADLYRKLRHGDKTFISMFGLAEREIVRLLDESNATVLRQQRQPTDSPRWLSLRFITAKRN